MPVLQNRLQIWIRRSREEWRFAKPPNRCPQFCPQNRRLTAILGDTGGTDKGPRYRDDDTRRHALNEGDTAGLGLISPQ
jgi:hypothetical protein